MPLLSAMATAFIKFTGLSAVVGVSLVVFTDYSAEYSREAYAKQQKSREEDRAYAKGKEAIIKELAAAAEAEADGGD